MFKYKVIPMGFGYAIYKRNRFWDFLGDAFFWKHAGLHFTHKGHAERYVKDMNHLEGVN